MTAAKGEMQGPVHTLTSGSSWTMIAHGPPMPPAAKALSATHDEQDYPLIGETLGLWKLVRGLGRGGMGEVYEAQYDFINLLTLRYPAETRPVVEHELAVLTRSEQARLASELLGTPLSPDAHFGIKICSARTGTAGHRRFLQEAELARRLGDHPYIVSIHALNTGTLSLTGADLDRFAFERGRHRDLAFMVMDLAARDYDHTKLDLAQAVHVVRCIATALDHAHSQGIVHRDLKPENLLGSVEHPLLTDFGIAKELDQSDGLTRTGQVIGTLDYMSPEQATDAKRVDHRSDIYSLGVVLYEMATQGSLPYYHKADRESCLHAIRTETIEPKWPRECVRDFPVGLERIILKAMAFQQEDRYQAMSEFIGDLDRWSRGEWISPVGRVHFTSWLRYHRRRHPRVVWGSLAVSMVALLALAVLLVLPLLDTQRRKLDDQLDHLERIVARVEAGTLAQPGKDDYEKFREVDGALRLVGNEYPAQVARRADIEARLLARRWLAVRFAGKAAGGMTIEAPDAASAREQLTIAGQLRSPDWTLEGDRGLVTQEPTQITLGPYGRGHVRVAVQVVAGDGFQLLLRDGDKLIRHQHLWRVQSGRLQQFFRADERPGQLLADEPVPPVITIEVELSPSELKVLAPTPTRYRISALAPDAPAWAVLNLPKGSALIALEIRPLTDVTPTSGR